MRSFARDLQNGENGYRLLGSTMHKIAAKVELEARVELVVHGLYTLSVFGRKH